MHVDRRIFSATWDPRIMSTAFFPNGESQVSGSSILVSGESQFVNTSTLTAWTAVITAVVPAGDGDWDAFYQPLGTTGITNTALTSISGFGDYVSLGVWGNPAEDINNGQAVDTIAVSFDQAVPAGNSFLLGGPGGTLISGSIDETGPYTFTFSALLNGVPVSTAGWTFAVESPGGGTPAWSYSVNAATGTITVNTDSIQHSGTDAYIVATPNTPVTEIEVTADTIPADAWNLDLAGPGYCYAAGTCIATPDGPVKVEDLAIGDTVCTLLGGTAPIDWIGRRDVDCRRHRAPALVWPVRIRAGAFGAGLPRRDLLLSPDHAVFADGVLIPVKYLVNTSTIAQVAVDRVTYYHVELSRHDLLLAEGLPTESLLPGGDRSSFSNGGGAVRLHADFHSRAWEAHGCAPLVVAGPQVDAVRRRLREGTCSVDALQDVPLADRRA